MHKSNGAQPDIYEPERVIPTDVPGIVLWQGRRRSFEVDGVKKRSRYYSLTHEASGVGTPRVHHRASAVKYRPR